MKQNKQGNQKLFISFFPFPFFGRWIGGVIRNGILNGGWEGE